MSVEKKILSRAKKNLIDHKKKFITQKKILSRKKKFLSRLQTHIHSVITKLKSAVGDNREPANRDCKVCYGSWQHQTETQSSKTISVTNHQNKKNQFQSSMLPSPPESTDPSHANSFVCVHKT